MLLFVSYEVPQFPFLDTSRKAAKIFIFYLTKGLKYFKYQSICYTVVIAFALKLYFILRCERRRLSLNLETFTESLKLWKKEMNCKMKRFRYDFDSDAALSLFTYWPLLLPYELYCKWDSYQPYTGLQSILVWVRISLKKSVFCDKWLEIDK